ncbi:MAG: hypothetical protein SNJ63_00990 [Sphingomonadaceae bacterium]
MSETTLATRLERLRALPAPVLWVLGAGLALLMWYGVIGGLRAGVAPDLALKPGAALRPAGSSAAVAYAARLVERETRDRAFTPNDPIVYPTAFARRTPAFQRAVIATVSEVLPSLPAVKSGGEDVQPLFEAAQQALTVPPDRYWLAFSWPPIRRPAERRYLDAVAALADANARLAEATPPAALAEQSPAVALRALALVLVEAAERGEAAIRAGGSSGPVLASQRGSAYAAVMILRGLREDHAAHIRASAQAARWAIAADALERAANVDPLFSSRSGLVEAGFALLIAARELDALAGDAP